MNFNHCIPFLGLKDSAKGAAKVGVTECTQDCQRYKDPDNANIEYYTLNVRSRGKQLVLFSKES